jgi:hypothetical protein
MDRLLNFITRQLPCRQIGDCIAEKGPLLVRYFLYRDPKERFGIYIHHLMRSDISRHHHDHPWTFVSLILTRGYIEHTPQGSRRYRAGAVLYRPATWQHHLELHEPAWTLIVRFKRQRTWGFHTETGLVPFDEYPGEACA